MTSRRTVGHWSLPAALSSARLARAHVREAVAEHPLLDDLELVTSELVANAVRHGSGPVDLTVETGPGTTRITVASAAADKEPEIRAPKEHESGGRGLAIVEALSERWGWDRRDGSVAVWAEFPDR